jgi:hypothetical protein
MIASVDVRVGRLDDCREQQFDEGDDQFGLFVGGNDACGHLKQWQIQLKA